MRPAPASRPRQACQGAIWIMLIFTTAVIGGSGGACSTGQIAAHASSVIGGNNFADGTRALHSSILPISARSNSLGCQRRGDNSGAKYAACWPVPLETSSTVPAAGNTSRSTSRITERLRSAAGARCSRLVIAPAPRVGRPRDGQRGCAAAPSSGLRDPRARAPRPANRDTRGTVPIRPRRAR